MTADCSIVVVTWNGSDWVESCLRSIFDQANVVAEIVVVDNASQDGTADLVAARFPQVRLVRNTANFGFASAANIGIRQASTPFVGLLNQDAEADPAWASSLLERFADGDRVAVVGSKILFPDRRTIQHAGGIITYPLGLANHRGYREPDDGQFDTTAIVDYVTGAAMMLRRSVFDELGGFDERFHPVYFEEADYCARARSKGYSIVYAPEAVAIHRESASTQRDSYNYFLWYHQGRIRYILKHLPTEEICDVYTPAERRRIKDLPSATESAALAEAYASVLPEIAALRDWADPAVAPFDDLVRSLRELSEYAASRAQGPVPDPLAIYLDQTRRIRRLQEPSFKSAFPVVGGLLARFRKLWNDVSTSWYVRPQIAQQNTWNEWAYQTLSEMAVRIGQLEHVNRLEIMAREQLAASVSERLNQHVSDLLARLEDVRSILESTRASLHRDEAAAGRCESVMVSIDRDLTLLAHHVGELEMRIRSVERETTESDTAESSAVEGGGAFTDAAS